MHFSLPTLTKFDMVARWLAVEGHKNFSVLFVLVPSLLKQTAFGWMSQEKKRGGAVAKGGFYVAAKIMLEWH